MTVAAMEAAILAACLAEGPEQLAHRFFTRVSKVIDIPWNITVGNDRRLMEPDRPVPPMARFINWYMGKLHIAARIGRQLQVHSGSLVIAPGLCQA